MAGRPTRSGASLTASVWLALGLSWAGAVYAGASDDAMRVAKGAVAARDTHGRPFAVVDKQRARVHVFAADGTLQGSSPVLLGLAKGDDSVPGIGERKMAEIRRHERTTPAGRFTTEPGRNLQGEDIVWVDYDAAVSMHRVRATRKEEQRLERLATPTVADNRISYGCINVPVAFYNRYIQPALGTEKGTVYVLPETSSVESRFPFLSPGKQG